MTQVTLPNGLIFTHRPDGMIEARAYDYGDPRDPPGVISYLISPSDWAIITEAMQPLAPPPSPNAISGWFDRVQSLLREMEAAKDAGISSRYLSMAYTDLETVAHWLRDAFTGFNLHPPQ